MDNYGLQDVFRLQGEVASKDGQVVRCNDEFKIFTQNGKLDFKVKLKEFDVDDWVKTKFKNTACMFYGKTGGGKTILSTYLIAKFFEQNREEAKKAGIIVVGSHSSAYERLMGLNKYIREQNERYSRNDPLLFTEDQIYYTNDINNVKYFFGNLVARKAAREKNLPAEEIPPEQQVSLKGKFLDALLTNWESFIFLFDDCISEFKDAALRPFWRIFCTTSRHYNITAFYILQDMAFLTSEMRTNVKTLFVVGTPPINILTRHCGTLLPLAGQKFERLFVKFKSTIFADPTKTVTIYTDDDSSGQNSESPVVLHYKVPNKFAEILLKFEGRSAQKKEGQKRDN